MEIHKILAENYDLVVQNIKKLDGYISTNYKIETLTKKLVLKIYPNEKQILDLIEAENTVLLQFSGESEFPQPVKNNRNKLLSFSDDKIYRLMTFIEGDSFAETPHSPQLFESFGNFLARMDAKISDLSNYVISARKFEWDLQHFQEFIPQKTKFIKDPQERKLIDYFILQHKTQVLPVLPGLRKQIIHNDANDWNIIIRNNKLTGIIDFGDLCYTQTINEAAIAISYAILQKGDPIKWAAYIIKGYTQKIKITASEADVLFWLIAARLCTSVCNSAHEKILQPENEYLSISEKPAWDLLKKWLRINPVFAINEFRKAAGLPLVTAKKTKDILTRRHKNINPLVSVSYKKPVYMERAAFQFMYDKYGNAYLDAYNNIPHVGHSHPTVVEAGRKQMARLNTNTRYLYDELNEYTSNLLKLFPEKLDKVFLVNSGSAASDLALRMARTFSGNNKIAVLEHGYHGNTAAGIEISHYKFAGKGGSGATRNVLSLPIPDKFRGEFRDGDAGNLYAQQAIQKMKDSEGIAAFIAEPIVGCGGQVPLAEGYLKEVYEAVRKHGGVTISDEVQTGFGRLGDVFWGYEMYDVVPDMVILGKPMGNGHPMGAVVTTNEIAEAFNNGMEFFSSFGGNPVSCAIGQAVLDVIEEEQLQQNAKEIGDYYIQKLRELQMKYKWIGDVRGSGLFIGFEFVKDRLTLEPYTELAQTVKNELRNRNILVSTDGPFDNVIKSKPPLCFTRENVDEVITKLDNIL